MSTKDTTIAVSEKEDLGLEAGVAPPLVAWVDETPVQSLAVALRKVGKGIASASNVLGVPSRNTCFRGPRDNSFQSCLDTTHRAALAAAAGCPRPDPDDIFCF